VDARDVLLEKPRHGPFQSTDLELMLRSRGIDTVIISGIATSVCCETTARKAVSRDFHVFFLIDGKASTARRRPTCPVLRRLNFKRRLSRRSASCSARC
jgi:nicotinamidase-related amidase